jgi:hypothetical protein
VLRKQYKDADSAGHNNRNLRSKTKQFAEDEWEQRERVVPILVFIKIRIVFKRIAGDQAEKGRDQGSRISQRATFL